jgi:hypothetical protein
VFFCKSGVLELSLALCGRKARFIFDTVVSLEVFAALCAATDQTPINGADIIRDVGNDERHTDFTALWQFHRCSVRIYEDAVSALVDRHAVELTGEQAKSQLIGIKERVANALKEEQRVFYLVFWGNGYVGEQPGAVQIVTTIPVI